MADVFSDDSTPADVTPTGQDIMLEDLVGEGKKFADAAALAKAKVEADKFIEQLKQENKVLRESVGKELNAAENLKSLQAKIAELEKKTTERPNPETTGALDQSQLERLVASVITKQEQTRTANQNLSAANDALVRIYGTLEKAKEAFAQRASELSMTVADLKTIAAKSPTAFGKVMGIEGKKGADNLQIAPPLNSAALPNVSNEPKFGSQAYYSKLRKEMGNTKFYADYKLQNQMLKHKAEGLYDAR